VPRIDLVEPYAIRNMRQWIRDSLMSHGEECILIHMWHVNEAEALGQPRCPVCYDDIYKQGEKFDCERCYGTTYDGGVKDIYRAWGLFTDSQDEENFSKRGMWHPIARSMQTEHIPDLWQRDYVVRVTDWTIDHRPIDIDGIYVMKEVSNESLRTGNVAGQTQVDNIAQRCDLDRAAEEMPIYQYPIIGQVFNRFDGNPR
jgi:hypothetical protein